MAKPAVCTAILPPCYGSYVKPEVDLNKAVNQIEIFDTGVALLAGAMIIPAVYVFSGTEGMSAGDAFWGAVLHQLRGKTAAELAQLPSQQLQQVVRFGNAAGSLTTMKSGAIPAMPTQEEIEACLKTRKLMEA